SSAPDEVSQSGSPIPERSGVFAYMEPLSKYQLFVQPPDRSGMGLPLCDTSSGAEEVVLQECGVCSTAMAKPRIGNLGCQRAAYYDVRQRLFHDNELRIREEYIALKRQLQ